MKNLMYLLIFLFSLIPLSTNASCDVGAVIAQAARSGLIGSSFGSEMVENCEVENVYTSPTYSSYSIDNSRVDYLNKLEIQKIENERDQKLIEIKNRYDKECKEKHTGINSHFDEKTGCVCNIGYGLLAGICESREAILDNMFEKTMLTLPEYKNVVNRELIKSLALDPTNGKLSMSQIIKNTYAGKIEEIKSASIQNSIINKTITPPETKSLQTKEIVVATTSLTETNLYYIEQTTESKKPWFSKVVSWFDFRKFFSK